MENLQHQIQFKDFARELLRMAPRTPQALTATGKALLLKKEKFWSIGALLEQQAEKHPDRTALRYLDQNYSYAQFNQQANRIAHYLQAQGIQAGDAVAVFMENRPEVLFWVAGIVKLGAIASMINTSQRDAVLIHSLDLVEPKLAVVGEELLDAFQDVQSKITSQPKLAFQSDSGTCACPEGFDDLNEALPDQATANPPQTQQVQLNQPAYYIFTSGTTGLPKASVMSHLRWMRACYTMGLASLGMKKEDVFYCCLPLYHNNALTLAWSASLGSGACLALSRKFSASRFWDEVREYQATVFCYIGELCRYLLSRPEQASDTQHAIRACMGNGLRPEIWDEFKQRYGITQINEFYGASEGNLVFTNAFNMDQTAGFCPMSFAIVEYDIDADEPMRDDKGQMIKVAKGQSGLLLTEVTERFSFEGYTDASASEKKLFRDVFKKGDCWFNTGDLVRNQGYKHIQFVDRLGDTFRWKGENVATTEVEAVLNRWGQTEQSVVYGVEVPHHDGRAGMSALTPNCPSEEIDWAGFSAHVLQQLPAYAVPLFIRLRAQQEVTGTFKYRKVELKQQAFDPEACGEEVFVLNQGQYQAISSDVLAKIQAGKFRF